MSIVSMHQWKSLEQWRAPAFLVGGGIFVVDAALLAVHLASGTEPAAFGQALVGASWTVAFVGLLGFYPSLADEGEWLPRVGAVFAGIGGITMAAMAATMAGYATGLLSGEPRAVTMYFLPGVFLGIVLGFGSFAVVSLRTTVYTRSIGLLFLLLPITFLFNLGTGVSGFNPLAKVAGVVVVLALTMLAIGYQIRTGNARADQEKTGTSSDVSVG